MKETLAKGGKIEKNMKKQSILNLVNSILLLCTLLFSVISFAWYSPNKDVGTPLSFGAGGAGGMVVHQLAINDLLKVDDDSTTYNDTELNITTRQAVTVLSNNSSEVNENTLLEFGAIDDLGYLKNSNCVYYCITIDTAEVGEIVDINLSYAEIYQDADSKYYVPDPPSSEDGTGYHFVLTGSMGADTRDDLTSFYAGVTNLESFDETSDWTTDFKTFIHFACVASDIPPQTDDNTQISADQLLKLFPTNGNKIANAVPVTEMDSTATDYLTRVDLSQTTDTDGDGKLYIYIKVTPNLDNYSKLAELLMGHMPFYMGFGLRLHVQAQPKTVAE